MNVALTHRSLKVSKEAFHDDCKSKSIKAAMTTSFHTSLSHFNGETVLLWAFGVIVSSMQTIGIELLHLFDYLNSSADSGLKYTV